MFQFSEIYTVNEKSNHICTQGRGLFLLRFIADWKRIAIQKEIQCIDRDFDRSITA